MRNRKFLILNIVLICVIFSGCSSNQNHKENEIPNGKTRNIQSTTPLSETAKITQNNETNKAVETTKLKETTKAVETTKPKETTQAVETTKPKETTQAVETTKVAKEAKLAKQGKKSVEFINSYTTNFDADKKNRVYNIKLATKKLNGTVIGAGETFSFNKIVGATGKKQGYKKAITYLNGKEEENYGGGICQVSSTILNAVTPINVKIVEQNHHSKPVAYVEEGKDAAVSYGGPDFKFKNTNSYPIQLNIEVKKSSITVSVSKIEYK